MTKPENPPENPPPVLAEPLEARDPKRLTHLSEHRGLIIRRSLLATGLGGFIPLPVMDDYVASRVRAGLFIRLAAARGVDLPQSSADLLSDPKDGSMVRSATLTAATLVALKLAWRKFFALLAAGRGAEDMATTFQFATLVDHYCARLHVGGAVPRARAAELRVLIHDSIDHTEKSALVATFRDGGRVLGRSVLEAPRWISQRLNTYAQRWAATGGRGSPFDPTTDLPADEAQGTEKWLDRAARVVEERIGGLGNDYLDALVDRFEEGWKTRGPEPASEPDSKPDSAPVETPEVGDPTPPRSD
jgi:hypothetical protein